jgi:hypothetical protein
LGMGLHFPCGHLLRWQHLVMHDFEHCDWLLI